jgi:(p)ppGpp synthase/HD superfamily hydrolase
VQTFDGSLGWPALRDRFAAQRHGTQTRPAGQPYQEHLLEALTVLVEAVGVSDVDTLVAAVLHDVVEDTDTSLDEIRRRFGERSAELVDWVTKPEPAAGQDRTTARTAYLDRLRDAPPAAIEIKLADRLSNVQRLDTHPRPEKRASYYRETVTSIVPLAAGHAWFAAWYGEWRRQFAHLADRPQ